MPKVFISHCTTNRSSVEERVVAPLSRNGIDMWFAEKDIQTSEEWERSIVRALEECDWFLVVMTPAAAESRWVRSEVHWAFNERPSRIVPALANDCRLTDFHLMMNQIQHIDFRVDVEQATAQLLKIWKGSFIQQLNNRGRVMHQNTSGRSVASAIGTVARAGNSRHSLCHAVEAHRPPDVVQAKREILPTMGSLSF